MPLPKGYTVESGMREVCGSRLAYDLYLPKGHDGGLGGVVMLHGFGANRRSLAGHAARLAAAGTAAVLTPDMSSLIAGGMEAAQARNIAQAADAAAWLASRPELANGPGVLLCGHSAGGAVVFEAAAALAAAGTPPRGVCMLDGVPWPRTLLAAPAWPAAAAPLMQARVPDSAWNNRGAMRAVLAAVPAPGAVVVELPRARHGDAMDPAPFALRLLGLLGAPGSGALFGALLDAFVQSALSAEHAAGFEAGPLAALAAAHPAALRVERRRGDAAPPSAVVPTAVLA